MKHKKDAHLSREALVALAADKNAHLPKHLQECPECRRDLEMLAEFMVVRRTRLSGPPANWINQAAMIMPDKVIDRVVGHITARLTFDSWLASEPVSVRGLDTTERRQMRFETNTLAIDLRAERDRAGWNIVAQVVGETESCGELRHGRKISYPDADGIYQWESKRPPSRMSIRVDDNVIEIPELKWTMPAKKKKPGDS